MLNSPIIEHIHRLDVLFSKAAPLTPTSGPGLQPQQAPGRATVPLANLTFRVSSRTSVHTVPCPLVSPGACISELTCTRNKRSVP